MPRRRVPFGLRARLSLAGAALAASTLVACFGPAPVTPTAIVLVVTATPVPTVEPTLTAAPTAPPTATALPSPTVITQEQVVAIVKQYTVYVWTEPTNGAFSVGTGISVGGGGVLTSYHVLKDQARPWVRFPSGRQEPAQLIGVDPRRDLALLRSSFTGEPAAPIGDAGGLAQGATLVAVGYPRTDVIGGQDPTVTSGIFSARRQVDGVWHVQTNADFNPGNSGGPLSDSQGRVIGVVRGGLRDAVGLNFAVASDEVAAFLANPRQAAIPPTTVPTAPAQAAIPPRFAGSTIQISDPAPAPRSTLSVGARILRDGQPVVGAEVHALVHYRTVDEHWPGGTGGVRTDASGRATIQINIGDAAPGYRVPVDVVAFVGSDQVRFQTAFTPSAPAPAPTPQPVTPPAAPVLVGLAIRAPADGSSVPAHVQVRGFQARPTPPGLHVWLVVGPRVEGGRWYPYQREIIAGPDGSWGADLDLGGTPNVQHELRAGVVDAEVHAALVGHVAAYPNQPLPRLPRGSWDEARVVVNRR